MKILAERFHMFFVYSLTNLITYVIHFQERHELVVEVRSDDHARVVPRVAHVIVDVEVIDINDNAPMFVNQPYYAILSKDTEKDATVLKVTAIDRDKGNNGDIYYQLVRGQVS